MIDVDREIELMTEDAYDARPDSGYYYMKKTIFRDRIKALLRQQAIQLFQELDKLKWSSAFVASEFENNIKEIKERYLG